MARARWHYATEEELAEIEKIPEPKYAPLPTVFIALPGGTIQDRDGNELIIPDEMLLKVLEKDTGDAWCYRAIEVKVDFPERVNLPIALLKGTPVALWKIPTDEPTQTSSQP